MSDEQHQAPTGVDPATLQGLLEATGGDLEFFADLVAEFADDGRTQLEAMGQALADADAPALTRAAHTLKSTAASFGATDLAEQSRALETQARAGDIAGADVAIKSIGDAFEQVVDALGRWRPSDP